MRHEVLDAIGLVARLGNQCSPMWNRPYYLIGPDANGRICHIGSYISKVDADAVARRLNEVDERHAEGR